MQVSVIGAGGIGSAIAAYLAASGHKVALVFKEKKEAHAVRSGGLRVAGVRSFTAPVEVIEWPSPIPPSDLLVLAVKTYDTREALRSALGVPVSMALSAQNGPQKEEALTNVLGAQCVVGAVIEVTATNQSEGRISNPDISLSHIGEMDGRESLRVKELARIFTEAGIPTQPSTEIRSVEWTKTCQWIATSLLSVMTGYSYSLIFSTEWLSPLFVQIVRECAAVARENGARAVEAPSLFVHHLLEGTSDKACGWLHQKGRRLAESWGAQYKASMLLDVEKRSRTEFDEIVRYVSAIARERCIETPALDFAIRQVRNYINSTLGADAGGALPLDS